MSKLPDYPRAAPYHGSAAPADADSAQLAAHRKEARLREASLRRWMMIVAGSAVAIVMLTVGLGVYLVIRAVQLRPAPAAVAARTDNDARPLPRPFEPPLLPREQSPGRPPSAAPALEALGALSAAHLYQSYLNIGLLADAAENEVYGDEEARKLLTSIAAWMDSVDGQLRRLDGAAFDAADQQRLAQVRRLTGLLRAQARALRAYWDAPEGDSVLRKDQEAKFHQARTDAWAGIKELLAIQED